MLRKKIAFILMFALLLSSCCADEIFKSTRDDLTIGNLYLSMVHIDVLCDFWDTYYGEMHGTSLAFNNNPELYQGPGLDDYLDGKGMFVYYIDGIYVEGELDILSCECYSMTVFMFREDDGYDSYQEMVRICAIVSTLTYGTDWGKADAATWQNQYLEIFQVVYNTTNELVNGMDFSKNDQKSFTFSGPVAEREFYIKWIDGQLLFTTKP